MKAYKTPMIDWSHSYWRYAELINGRLAHDRYHYTHIKTFFIRLTP
ncbi:MAG: hypothetical protein CM15mP10_0390 [Actinomycetota bacterium]|nr:MAG: hypothetical protein CM15mP10_0390 [Actinomycetota bacterium]